MDGYTVSSNNTSRYQGGLPRSLRPRPDLVRKLRPWRPFALCVLLPVLLATFYYTLIASNQYYSDAEFVIRSPSKGGSASSTPLTSLLQSTGISRSQDDTYSVNDYMLSRDALAELVKNDDLRRLFDRPEADFLARFPHLFGRSNFEALYKYYLRHVTVEYDTTSGITTLEVRAFRPEDAQRLANALLQSGENLLNRLNARALENAVRDSQREVSRMEDRVVQAQLRMSTFRNHETMIDPTKESQTMLLGVAEMRRQLAATQTLISQLQHTSPGSPMLIAAERRSDAIREQIIEQQARVAGSDSSMVPRISTFEELQLQQEFAQKGLTAAVSALETARLDAERQQLYLDPVVAPNIADAALYPRRFTMIAIVFATFLTIYLIGRLLVAGVREHQAH